MKKTEIDWDKVTDMKNRNFTWQQISDVIGLNRRTIEKRAHKHGIIQKVPFQKDKRRCTRCRNYYMYEELTRKRYGLFCDECARL